MIQLLLPRSNRFPAENESIISQPFFLLEAKKGVEFWHAQILTLWEGTESGMRSSIFCGIKPSNLLKVNRRYFVIYLAFNRLHDVISQKTELLITKEVSTSSRYRNSYPAAVAPLLENSVVGKTNVLLEYGGQENRCI
jgi:hypothetical protein